MSRAFNTNIDLKSNSLLNVSSISGLTANPLTVSQGGTGATTFPANAVLVGNGTSAIQASSGFGGTIPTSSTRVLVSSGSPYTPTYGTVSLSDDYGSVSGTLKVGNGGTGGTNGANIVYTNYSNGFSVGGQSITSASATTVPLVLRHSTTPTADALQVQTYLFANIAGYNAAGQSYSGSITPIASQVGGAPISSSWSGGTFQLNLTSAPNVAIGDLIVVANLTSSSSPSPNGTFYVTGVSNSGSFWVQYYLQSAPTIVSYSGSSVSAPAQASVTARSAGTKGLVVQGAASQTANLLEVQNSSGTPLLSVNSAGTASLKAGATNSAPLLFQSGTNLTTVAAGAAEFDGSAFYLTPDATSGRAFVPVTYSATITTQRVHSNTTTTKEAIFTSAATTGGGANGALPLKANTSYFFRGVIAAQRVTAASSAVFINSAFSQIPQSYYFGGSALNTASAVSTLGYTTSQTADFAVSNVGTTGPAFTLTNFYGTFKTNATTGGTFTPVFFQGASNAPIAAACTIEVGSFIEVIQAPPTTGGWT